jgi:hypothetical protein
MTTIKQAAHIELRLHVHSQLMEVFMLQCGVDRDEASVLAYGRMKDWSAARSRKVKSYINNGFFDHCHNPQNVAHVLDEIA